MLARLTPQRATDSRMRIFISHASGDTWVARQIAGHIQAVGGSTFLDEADIQRGDDFLERVLDAEQACGELLVLLTASGLRRPWVLFEISCFRHSHKRIVGVVHGLSVDDIRADPYVGVLLDRRSLIDINQLDTYFLELRTRIAAAAAATSE